MVTASGSLGLLFFPSLPVILYGVVAKIGDLNQLYIAGLVPGILMILLVCLAPARHTSRIMRMPGTSPAM